MNTKSETQDGTATKLFTGLPGELDSLVQRGPLSGEIATEYSFSLRFTVLSQQSFESTAMPCVLGRGRI